MPRPDDGRRRPAGERPSEAATGSSRRIVNRVRRDPAGSPVKEWVARAIVGQSVPYAPVPRSWTDQYGLNVQIVGDHTEAETVVLEGERAAHRYVATYFDARGRIVSAVCAQE